MRHNFSNLGCNYLEKATNSYSGLIFALLDGNPLKENQSQTQDKRDGPAQLKLNQHEHLQPRGDTARARHHHSETAEHQARLSDEGVGGFEPVGVTSGSPANQPDRDNGPREGGSGSKQQTFAFGDTWGEESVSDGDNWDLDFDGDRDRRQAGDESDNLSR